ncbi:MAG: NAD-dependent deacylase [Bacteroidota bacterium]
MKRKLVILSGAGISAESGVQTFRDSGGLWEGHNVMDVASPEGYARNPELVLDFYNKRRQQLKEVSPNLAHQILVELETFFDVQIITQNVDDLHERAGSSNVLHLHGELLKIRSTKNQNYIRDWTDDLFSTHTDDKGNKMRPHIVWFGEEVPALEQAVELVQQADVLIIIGTSLQVYPAAGLMNFAKPTIPVYYIDPNPATIYDLPNDIKVIATTGSKGMEIVRKELQKLQ